MIFSPEAASDLAGLYDFLTESAGPERARVWLGRFEAHCLSFEIAAERGARRDDIRPGLRISSFERRITLAFTVTPTQVLFLRFFYAGANWEPTLSD